jgi:hypothetical protein
VTDVDFFVKECIPFLVNCRATPNPHGFSFHYFILFYAKTNNLKIFKIVLENCDFFYGFNPETYINKYFSEILNNAILNRDHNVEIVNYLLGKGYYKFVNSTMKTLSVVDFKEEIVQAIISYNEKISNYNLFKYALRNRSLKLCKHLIKKYSYIEKESKTNKVKSSQSFLNKVLEETNFESFQGN